MRASSACVVEPLELRTLLSIGDLDLRFGGGGVMRNLFGGTEGAGNAGAALPDGKVLVAGARDNAFLLARYNPDGTLDPSFGGGDGFVTTDFSPPSRLAAETLTVLPGGKILLAGSAEAYDPITGNSVRAIAIARYTAGGALDTTFGRGGPEGDGKVVDRPGTAPGTWAEAHSVVALPTGKFLLAGTVRNAPAVFRYNADGTLDTSFGGGDGIAGGLNSFGSATFSPRASPVGGWGNGLAMLPGGKILLTGGMQVYETAEEGPGDSSYDVATLDRFNGDGTADVTFGDGTGRVVIASVPALEQAVALPDGRVLAVVPFSWVSSSMDFAVARLNPDGSLDPTFAPGGPGGGGVAAIDFFGRDDRAGAIAVDSAGRVLVTGSAQRPTGSSENHAVGLARLLPDGTRDTTFGGGDGVVAFDAGAPAYDNAGRAVFFASEEGVADATAIVVGMIDRAPAVARVVYDLPLPPASIYEAERAAITGAAVSRAHPGFTGTGYVDYARAAGDSVEFTVDVPVAGTYELAFRYAHGGTSARKMGLLVTGTAVPGGLSFAPTGSWQTWDTRSLAVPLAAGSNKVSLLATGQSGPNLDSLSVRALSPVPAQVYQAESAVLSGPLVASNVPGFTGAGFADYQHGTGDSVEFTIEVPADGAYALDFRYANGSAADRALGLRVDGNVAAARMSFAPTGAWRNWQTASQSVLFTAGRHTVRLASVGLNGPNLDALTVRAAPAGAAAIPLRNATATFSQAYLGPFLASEMIDGSLDPLSNGWSIYDTNDPADPTRAQTAVFETAADAGGPGGTVLTFTMDMAHWHEQHTPGRFRLSVTTDPRSVFADGLQVGGDVTAQWSVLTPTSVRSDAGAMLTVRPDGSILAGGPSPANDRYVLTSRTSLAHITGVRLEVLEDPSLPSNGPGRFPDNGNFCIVEIGLTAAPATLP